jgi:hypothetical protein
VLYLTGNMLSSLCDEYGATIFSKGSNWLWTGQVDEAGNGYLFTSKLNGDQTATTYIWDVVRGRFVNGRKQVHHADASGLIPLND